MKVQIIWEFKKGGSLDVIEVDMVSCPRVGETVIDDLDYSGEGFGEIELNGTVTQVFWTIDEGDDQFTPCLSVEVRDNNIYGERIEAFKKWLGED